MRKDRKWFLVTPKFFWRIKNLFTKYPPGQDITLVTGNTGKNLTAVVWKFGIYHKDSYARTIVIRHKKSRKAKQEMKQSF